MVELKTDRPGFVSLEGELNAQTVVQAYAKGNVFFNGVDRLTFDLKGISRSDSAGLALLLAWMRRAQAHQVQLEFVNLPQKMRDLGRVCGLDKVLPMAKDC